MNAVSTRAVLLVFIASVAASQTPPLEVRDAWIRATPGSDIAAAYLTLRNVSSNAVTVTGVQSAAAAHAMIHETSTQGGQSRMRAHAQLVIAPGQTIKLEPGGLHVMLHGLSQPLAVGQSVPLVLSFAGGNSLQVTAAVRPLAAQ
jgi:copper(I)-binding protein